MGTNPASGYLVAWTEHGSSNAWLVLDRNGNGTIDDVTELFGNRTAQPSSPVPNGFKALAVFDTAAEGGNGDGTIDQRDPVFFRLRLWQDRNHNGISEAGELSPVSAFGIIGFELRYHESRRVDEHGNAFAYRARVLRTRGGDANRWAWDVYLRIFAIPSISSNVNRSATQAK